MRVLFPSPDTALVSSTVRGESAELAPWSSIVRRPRTPSIIGVGTRAPDRVAV